jgi:hypothetical protein
MGLNGLALFHGKAVTLHPNRYQQIANYHFNFISHANDIENELVTLPSLLYQLRLNINITLSII